MSDKVNAVLDAMREKRNSNLNRVLKKCFWDCDSDSGYEYYETSCGNAFIFEGELSGNGGKFKYCPYCGSEIEESK